MYNCCPNLSNREESINETYQGLINLPRRQDPSVLAGMSEYLVFVLVTSVFSLFSSSISNPLQAFALFCALFHDIDWPHVVIGVFQICRSEDFSSETRPAHTPFQSHIATVIGQYAEKYQRSKHRRKGSTFSNSNTHDAPSDEGKCPSISW